VTSILVADPKVSLKAILFGPIFILLGLFFIPAMFSSGDGVVWQTRVAGPAAIVGGIILLWIGIRSEPKSPEETGEAVTDVAKDVVRGILDQFK